MSDGYLPPGVTQSMIDDQCESPEEELEVEIEVVGPSGPQRVPKPRTSDVGDRVHEIDIGPVTVVYEWHVGKAEVVRIMADLLGEQIDVTDQLALNDQVTAALAALDPVDDQAEEW